MNTSKRILVAPLDWGLGHASRCIPIIRLLIKKNCTVYIASSGRALELLRKEFPELRCFEIVPYGPVYPSGASMVFSMAIQVPKFLSAIRKEQIQIEKIVERNQIDVVISDNRYGAYSKQVKSIFITHQLNIQMPGFIKWFEEAVNRQNEKYIQQFAECWIPAPEKNFIPLLLKHKGNLNLRYLGLLSRFEKKTLPKKFKVCAICSGPEPQRTVFDNMLSAQLKKMNEPTIIIRGKTETPNKYFNKYQQFTIANYLTSEDLNEVIAQSEVVIARSGYSTVMDMARMEARAVFVPTPGQTEQQYISAELMKNNIAYSVKQSQFDLRVAIAQSENYSGFHNFDRDDSFLEKAIDSIL